ncbi:MAG TPA: class I tRNA ligase family protein [Dissulfurispiraceae bacterium]|nr:class I tRNA ligase family protein [Dissulfurispiraceae bacterium]
MLKLFNTFGRKIETFRPVNPEMVTIFTCGPSVYQRAHIGNMRTFLFEDVLVRYLEYSGFAVRRGMIITDIEDKALREAEKEKTTVKKLTDRNIGQFLKESDALGMKRSDYLPLASEHVEHAVTIIQELLKRRVAYWHNSNVYFDPLRFKGFGKLFGLDMTKWPKKKRRFHKDTYPGAQWNLGDFILWHGCPGGKDGCWDTVIGRGRPSWNVQDASTLLQYFNDTLSIYCGGVDNLYRHHDYNIAILESVRPYPMARYWLHGHYLHVDGRKMSKSKGNIVYTDTLRSDGYSFAEIRFFLLNVHYRETLDFRAEHIQRAASRLQSFRSLIRPIAKKAAGAAAEKNSLADRLSAEFRLRMDDDLNIGKAFDATYALVASIETSLLSAGEAAAIVNALKGVDTVFNVLFSKK